MTRTRHSITLPEHVWEIIKIEAEKLGLSASAYLCQLVCRAGGVA